MARRKPVSIASEGMYRKVGVVALGLALCAAFLGNDTTQTPAAARARTSQASQAVAQLRRHAPLAGLAEGDGPVAQDHDTEIDAMLSAGSVATTPDPTSDQGAPPQSGSASAGAHPSQAQIRTLIEQSSRRSGNAGGGD